MKLPGFLRPGIQRRLFMLAVGLSLPLAILAGARAFERLRAEESALTARSLLASERAAQMLDDDLNRARILLLDLSRSVSVDAPVTANDSVIRGVFRATSPGFTNLWIANTAGEVKGSLVAPTAANAGITLADRDYFKEALRTRAFVVGQPVRSRIFAGAPWTLPFVLPVIRGSDQAILGVAGASILVDSLAAMRIESQLPEGSVITVLRDDGRVFLRSVDLGDWITRSFAGNADLDSARLLPAKAMRVASLDGTDRLVARTPLRSFDGVLYVGIPISATLELARRQFVRDLLLGVLTTVLVAILAVTFARRIADPLLALTDAARALSRGEHNRRLRVDGTDEIGELAGAFNFLSDVVQDREKALEQSEVRYRQLFATNPLPMLTWSQQTGRIDQVNDAARTFFGTKRLEGSAQFILDLIAAEDRERFSALPLPEPGARLHAGVWKLVDARNEMRDVEMVVGTIEREEQPVAVAAMLDLTDRLRTQRDLEASREQLRQSQKMEALGSFAGGIAHDFNNYLSTIVTNAEMLREDLPRESPAHVEASEILGAAQRATVLTRQILVFSRRQVRQEERIDVNAVLQEIEVLLRRLLGESIEFRLACATGLPPVLLDRGRLEQVVMNLAANARDAMRQGGLLTITTRRARGGTVEVVVADTGKGIPEDVRPRIFEPFFTTKERGRGTGLGLAMVHSIISSARGSITVESVPNQGTQFSIVLPAASDRNTPTSIPRIDDDVLGGTEHVLVVEDDESVRLGTTTVLTRAGYRVTAMASGRSALDWLDSASTRPALLLTDVVMPLMSGPELATLVATRYPAIRVLFMSGYADDDALMDRIASSSIRFLAKPFARAELLRAVRRALDLPGTV